MQHFQVDNLACFFFLNRSSFGGAQSFPGGCTAARMTSDNISSFTQLFAKWKSEEVLNGSRRLGLLHSFQQRFKAKHRNCVCVITGCSDNLSLATARAELLVKLMWLPEK